MQLINIEEKKTKHKTKTSQHRWVIYLWLTSEWLEGQLIMLRNEFRNMHCFFLGLAMCHDKGHSLGLLTQVWSFLWECWEPLRLQLGLVMVNSLSPYGEIDSN
jgi:hypothetical protein